MDTGAPWICAACDAANAAYRRRCLDCGATRRAEATATAWSGPVDVDDIPLPRIARRRERTGSPWPRLVLTAVVLALAAYGAVTYLTADRPGRDDDEAALRAAVPGVFEGAVAVVDGGLADDLVDPGADPACLDVSTDLLGLLDAHATVALDVTGAAGRVAMHVFDTRSAAVDFDDALRRASLDGCAPAIVDRRYVVTGRARIEVRGVAPDAADALLAQFVARLELEG